MESRSSQDVLGGCQESDRDDFDTFLFSVLYSIRAEAT